MKFKKAILFILLVHLNCLLFAQDTNTDTTASVEDQNQADTVLIQDLRKIKSADIYTYRSSKDFAYIQYLDSLLRKTKDIKSDTFSLNSLRNGKSDNTESKEETTTPTLSFLDNPLLKILLWLLAAGFIGFILFKLFSTGGFFQKKTKEQQISNIDEQELNLGIEKYDELINKAVKEQNYSLAIRYWYLQTLQLLNEKGIIQCSAEKTNFQYARELAGKAYANEFASLTMSYDYTWYGKFDISPDTYQRIENDFKSFHKRIRS
jgi:hypothetical protein